MNAVIRFAYGKAELYPRFPLWIGEVLTYVQKPRFESDSFKGQTVKLTVDLRTLRYGFKAFPLFAGKFQPFEFKTDFSVFSASILSSPVFKGNSTVTKIPCLPALESNLDSSPLIAL